MPWTLLPAISLNKDGAYVPIPLSGAGGRVPVQIPAFPVGQEGSYEMGIYNIPQTGDLGLVSPAQTVAIARYTRNLIFEVPPNTSAPHIGVRLLTHAELETKNFSLAIQWQPPYGSGTGDGGGTPVPSGFIAAVPWGEIKQTAIDEIARGYATTESVTGQFSEIQNEIDLLAAKQSLLDAIARALPAPQFSIRGSSDRDQLWSPSLTFEGDQLIHLVVALQFDVGEWRNRQPELWIEKYSKKRRRWTHPPHNNGEKYPHGKYWSGQQSTAHRPSPPYPPVETEIPIPASGDFLFHDVDIQKLLHPNTPGLSSSGNEVLVRQNTFKIRFRFTIADPLVPGGRRLGPPSQALLIYPRRATAPQSGSSAYYGWGVRRI